MEEPKRLVQRRVGHKVTVSRYHTDSACSMYRTPITAEEAEEFGADAQEVVEVSERECDLLGLIECKECWNRRTGGPAINIITEFLRSMDPNATEESLVVKGRCLVSLLADAGFYFAKRR